MLPYVRFQLLYVALSGCMALGTWWLAGRVGARARWLPLRLALAATMFTCVSLSIGPLGGFGVIALLFYALALWWPLVVIVQAVRPSGERRRIDWLPLAASLVAMGIGLYGMLIEPNRMQLVQSELSFEAWPADAPALRVVHISDLQTVGTCERERRAARTINGLEPDLIVFSGDYVAGPFDNPQPAIDAARAFFGALRAPLGIVCVSGHSESDENRRAVLRGIEGVHYLNNEELELELPGKRRLRIVGLTPHHPVEVDLRREPGLLTLVASHMPDVTRRLEGCGVDLHLAGHTHGGQVIVPGFGPPITLSNLPRRFARGLHRFGDHWLNVTPGIGMEGHHAPRIRFLCPPQIDFLELKGSGGPNLAHASAE
jgi:hypothetical protein